MAQNPYSLVFGKEPSQVISRTRQIAEIIDAFSSDVPSQQVYIISGVRGSGKTVLMTEASKELAKNPSWIVVELNPERDMLQALAAKLSSENSLARIFKSSKINLSFFGLGLEVGGEAPITDIETALSKMLASLKKHGKRVLVTVDEAANTKEMKTFTAAFQILLRQDMPLFLLMTGLYENIHALQNEKSLTFLYRAPKIFTTPLNTGAMAENYHGVLGIDADTARNMARLTCGYPFAFQVLGYLCWKKNAFNQDVQKELQQYLEDYVYEKIWAELSDNDRRVAYGIASTQSDRIADVRATLEMDTNHFNPYRKRLINKGLIDGSSNGRVKFTLPFFREFALENYAD